MTGPGPAEAAARVAVRRCLADLAPGALVLVGCSGGADSLALAAAAAFVAPRAGLRAGAVVVDHGLQDGSARVAARAAAACRSLGLEPVEVRRVLVRGGGGPEAAARAARRAALEQAARDHGAAVVLLAHTLDDQAEQVLLALARGSGARSLAGMPQRSGVFRRPFLGLRRAQTEDVCRARGLAWWDDPTNGRPATSSGSTDALPLRSRVRAHGLPALEDVLGPGVPEALARSAAQLADDADLLDGLARDLLVRARAAAGPGRIEPGEVEPGRTEPGEVEPGAGAGEEVAIGAVVLDVAVLASAHRAVRTRALRRAALAAGSPAGSVSAAHVAALDALVVAWRGQGAAHLPGPVLAARECGTLVLRPRRTGRRPDAAPDPLQQTPRTPPRRARDSP